MATRRAFRSATEATRFTSTTPHASSKHPSSASSAASSIAASQSTSSTAKTRAAGGPRSQPAPGGRPGETPEDRVRRLRAAHEAARKAQVSGYDQAIGTGRRFFDYAHRFTVAGLLGFTALAGLVSIYSVYDMVTYNRQRRAEFLEAQKLMEEDELATARLAFINGTATDDQILFVEDATARAREGGYKLPPLLTPAGKTGAATVVEAFTGQDTRARPLSSSWEDTAAAAEAAAQATSAEEQKRGWWPFGGKKTEGDASSAQASLRESAAVAFEKEKERQQNGGPLDRVGVEPVVAAVEEQPKKKGWW